MKTIFYRSTLIFLLILISVSCDEEKIDVADKPYADTFVAEPTDELLESGVRFPKTLNIQILNGNSIGTFPEPAQLTCPPTSHFSAIAHNWSSPNSCAGYLAATSPLVTLSERQATGFISGITCPNACVRTQSIVWRGWACGHDGDNNNQGTRNSASGMAVSRVTCTAP